MTTELIEERFVVTGAQQANQSYAAMAAGLGNVATAGAAAKAATAEVGGGLSGLVNTAKGSAIALGQFANAAQGIIPELGGVGAAIVRSSGVIGAFAAQIGTGGVFAVAAGAATVALGLLSDGFNDQAKEAEAAAKASEHAAIEINKVANAIEFFKKVRSAAQGPDFTKLNVEELTDAIRELRLEATNPLTGKVVPEVAAQLQQAQDTLAALRLATTDASKSLSDLRGSGEGKTAPKAKEPFDLYGSHQDALNIIADAQKDIDAFKSGVDEENLRKEKEFQDGISSIQDAQRAYEMAQHRQHEEEYLALRKATAEKAAAIEKRELENRARAIHIVGDATASVASQMVATVVSGQKLQLDAMLKAIGGALAGQGAADLVHALFEAASPFPWVAAGAAAQIPLALEEIALGTAMGGAGAAIGSGRGGGGGGGGRGSFQRTGAPASPTPYNVRDGSADINGYSGPPVNINVFGKPDADVGEFVNRSMKRAQQQGRV